MSKINLQELKKDLINYYGTAMTNNPMAVIDLSNIENANEEDLFFYAKQAGIDIQEYIEDEEFER